MKFDSTEFDLDRRSRSRRHQRRRVAQLVLLAVAADVIVLLVEVAAGLEPLADFQHSPVIYVHAFVVTIGTFGVFGAVLGSREAMLEEMAYRDSLTGLLNSRFFHVRLREEIASARRHERPTSLVLLDIDHFKKVNDEHGHPVGNRLLEFIGQAIQSVLREGEIAARVGGEEFALLLPGATAGDAAIAAERFRVAMGQVTVNINNDRTLAVTVSAGVACANPDGVQDGTEIYNLADRALYAAKEQGRNRVVNWMAGKETTARP